MGLLLSVLVSSTEKSTGRIMGGGGGSKTVFGEGVYGMFFPSPQFSTPSLPLSDLICVFVLAARKLSGSRATPSPLPLSRSTCSRHPCTKAATMCPNSQRNTYKRGGV